jgi:hypothetical protein
MQVAVFYLRIKMCAVSLPREIFITIYSAIASVYFLLCMFNAVARRARHGGVA